MKWSHVNEDRFSGEHYKSKRGFVVYRPSGEWEAYDLESDSSTIHSTAQDAMDSFNGERSK